MFWGSGDTSKLLEEEKKTLFQLRRMAETGHIVALDPKQTAVAIRAIEFYSRFESVFRLMESFKNIAMIVGFVLAVYWATEGAVVTWITDIVDSASDE